GRDEHGYPDGLVLHQDAVGAAWRHGHIAIEAHGLFGEPSEELGSVGDFAFRVRQRLAVFEADQLGKHLLTLDHQFIAAAQDIGALARWGRGPVRPGFMGRRYSGERILDRGICDTGDHLTGGRIDHIELIAGTVGAPLSADPQIGRHGCGIERKRKRVHQLALACLVLVVSMARSPAKAAAISKSMPARSTGRGLFLISRLAARACSAIQGRSSDLTPISANVLGTAMVFSKSVMPAMQRSAATALSSSLVANSRIRPIVAISASACSRLNA